MANTSHNMDVVFTHVRLAMEHLDKTEESYNPQKARRLLHMIFSRLALETIKVTGADFGSEHMKELTHALNNPFVWDKQDEEHENRG